MIIEHTTDAPLALAVLRRWLAEAAQWEAERATLTAELTTAGQRLACVAETRAASEVPAPVWCEHSMSPGGRPPCSSCPLAGTHGCDAAVEETPSLVRDLAAERKLTELLDALRIKEAPGLWGDVLEEAGGLRAAARERDEARAQAAGQGKTIMLACETQAAIRERMEEALLALGAGKKDACRDIVELAQRVLELARKTDHIATVAAENFSAAVEAQEELDAEHLAHLATKRTLGATQLVHAETHEIAQAKFSAEVKRHETTLKRAVEAELRCGALEAKLRCAIARGETAEPEPKAAEPATGESGASRLTYCFGGDRDRCPDDACEDGNACYDAWRLARDKFDASSVPHPDGFGGSDYGDEVFAATEAKEPSPRSHGTLDPNRGGRSSGPQPSRNP